MKKIDFLDEQRLESLLELLNQAKGLGFTAVTSNSIDVEMEILIDVALRLSEKFGSGIEDEKLNPHEPKELNESDALGNAKMIVVNFPTVFCQSDNLSDFFASISEAVVRIKAGFRTRPLEELLGVINHESCLADELLALDEVISSKDKQIAKLQSKVEFLKTKVFQHAPFNKNEERLIREEDKKELEIQTLMSFLRKKLETLENRFGFTDLNVDRNDSSAIRINPRKVNRKLSKIFGSRRG